MLKLKRWHDRNTGKQLPSTLAVRPTYDFTREDVLYMLAVHASDTMLDESSERGTYNLTQKQIPEVLKGVLLEHSPYAIEYRQVPVENREFCWQWAREQLDGAWPEDQA